MTVNSGFLHFILAYQCTFQQNPAQKEKVFSMTCMLHKKKKISKKSESQEICRNVELDKVLLPVFYACSELNM